ncbi:MAG: hypothetical protein OEZ68_11805 [Gammaproteobacteria bacterium]|nr:hypothetical protein [Gammaproteobacteria bacterium]MDH5801479.1 hypothetical protein [Gammaproteobacteria bacterium]
MVEDEFDLDLYDTFGDENLELDEPSGASKLNARQRYDRLMEEKRVRQQLEDDFRYW